MRRHDSHRSSADGRSHTRGGILRPYKLIVTHDPHQTLGEGRVRHYPTMLDAANAFAKASEPYRQVIYDNGHEARELNEQEQRMLEHVCQLLGLEVEEVEG